MSEAADASGLMDRIYRHQRHIYDVTRRYFLLGRNELIADLAPAPGARILEVGCGTGRNLVQIARRYPQARCYGFDISPAMLETARAAVAKAGLASRITLAEGDATRFDPQAVFGVAAFDRVVVSYTLSMIPPWQAALARAATVVAPGGSLHVVDFGDQARLPGAFAAVLRAWLDLFHVAPRLDLPAQIERIGREHQLVGATRPLYRGYALMAAMSRPA